MSGYRLVRAALLGAALAASATATARANARGAGSSGGGLMLKDSLNPWFLQNTPEVHYCVTLNAASFSADKAAVSAQLTRALTYWQNELAQYQPPHQDNLQPPNIMQVGTQRFVEVPCGPGADLTLAFGAASPQQQAVIDDFANTVAQTVRTAYDRVNLRGQGFIYVAPDQGTAQPRPKELGDGFWSVANGQMLYLTLVHELGHVFGLPDSGMNGSVMSYSYVETLVAMGVGLVQQLGDLPPQQTVKVTHNWLDGVGVCYDTTAVTDDDRFRERVVGIPAQVGTVCSSLRYHDRVLQMYAGPGDDQMQLVGEATLDEATDEWSGQALVTMWLPPEQQVYQYKDPSAAHDSLRFCVLRADTVHVTGTYTVLSTGFKTPISFTLRPEDLGRDPQVAAVVDGRLYPALFDGTPTPVQTVLKSSHRTAR